MKAKKIISIILSICTVFSISTISAYATTNNKNFNDVYNNEKKIQTRANEVCSGYPYHIMMSHGLGNLYKGSYPDTSNLIIKGGAIWQCRNCNVVMVTEGEPLLGQEIGYYAVEEYSQPLANLVSRVWSNNIYYSSKSTLSGYDFRYSPLSIKQNELTK